VVGEVGGTWLLESFQEAVGVSLLIWLEEV